MTIDRVALVTKQTALDELVARYNSSTQARFYIEHQGGSFDEYAAAHDCYTVDGADGRAVAEALDRLSVGAALYAFDDVFIGAGSHVAPRHRSEFDGRAEDQSGSALLVSAGAASPGRLESTPTGAVRVRRGV